ncbi:LytR/AlgR family response regulator transcription factor [Ferruginibacter sp. SUN106]|uniref:LytR/AlgR family response regulator transcription factor n=1 Tax=Ferruginibacter sp. SUN106 TaxID=2978348 RepID=UPI003D360E88
MQTISAIIIDDEPGNIVTLSELIKQYCPNVNIVQTAPDPLKGYELIKETEPELVFLDIEMPYGNAFDLLDRLLPVSFEVIFVTAFNDYAIKAFKYAALDYLLKPVNINELKEAVNKVEKRIKERSLNDRISTLLNNFKPENAGIQKIALPTADGCHFEDISNIMYLQAEGSYTHIHIKRKEKILVSKTLKLLEDILPSAIFCRIHHSCLININYVKKYYKGRGGYVQMEDDTCIEISIRKKNDFFDRFK